RRYGSTAELSLRIGSAGAGGREPVWARWICDMDRPLPAGASVVWATVHVRQRGPHSEWSLCLTLKVPGEAWAKDAGQPARMGRAVAVDLGWRVEGDKLRVAAWADEHGGRGLVHLDAATLALLRSPAKLRGQQDDEFNGARLALRWWLTYEDEARSTGTVPDWLREAIAEMSAWKNPGRLVRVWQHWAGNRFEGDESVFGMLTAWRHRAFDQWSAESKNRLQSLRRRREIYRVFAAGLARGYDTVVLEQFDLREVARREKLADTAENEVSRSNRQLACVSELRSAIIVSCNARGRDVRAMPAADTTRTCPACGLVADRDAEASIELVCECGARWDQDLDGAAPVLLARWRERPGDAKIPAGARKPEKASDDGEKHETRWERVARLRRQKEARMGGAREPERKYAE
ncbi:MAG TPA: zinc ribbon domain-containing protein, partial [Polyangiaceae bacterium]